MDEEAANLLKEQVKTSNEMIRKLDEENKSIKKALQVSNKIYFIKKSNAAPKNVGCC